MSYTTEHYDFLNKKLFELKNEIEEVPFLINNPQLMEVPQQINVDHEELLQNTDQDVTVTKTAEVKTHHFAQKANISSKASQKEKEKKRQEDPFGMLANCNRSTASAMMVQIMDSLSSMEGLMNEQIPSDKNEFAKEQTKRVASYNQILEKCNTYLQNKKPRTANGISRKGMIENIKIQCQNELESFEAASGELFKSNVSGEALTWLDVLKNIRTESINMDEKGKKVTLGGAATSEVLICEMDDKKYYFKKEEVFHNTPTQTFARNLLNSAEEGTYLAKIRQQIEADDKLKNKFFEEMETHSMIYSYDKWEPDLSTNFEKYKNILKADYKSGIFNICPIESPEDLKAYLNFNKSLCRNSVTNDVCSGIAGIETGAILSNHNVATSRVANLLGVPDLIASSKNVNLIYKDETLKGNMMDEAKGQTYGKIVEEAEASNKRIEYSPEVLQQINSLLIMDYLCGQVDRNQSNFLCQTSEEDNVITIKSITGIDNDMSFGIYEIREGTLRLDGQLPAFTDKQDKCSVTALTPDFISSIMSLTPEILTYSVKDLVSEESCKSLAARLQKLKDLIGKYTSEGQIKIIDKNKGEEWKQANDEHKSFYL